DACSAELSGKNRPHPRGSAARPWASYTLSRMKNHHTYAGRKQRVEKNHGEKRRTRENPELSENSRHQKRINRSQPRGRSRLFSERRAESFSQRQRLRDASGFLAEHRNRQHVMRKLALLVPGKAQPGCK